MGSVGGFASTLPPNLKPKRSRRSHRTIDPSCLENPRREAAELDFRLNPHQPGIASRFPLNEDTFLRKALTGNRAFSDGIPRLVYTSEYPILLAGRAHRQLPAYSERNSRKRAEDSARTSRGMIVTRYTQAHVRGISCTSWLRV